MFSVTPIETPCKLQNLNCTTDYCLRCSYLCTNNIFQWWAEVSAKALANMYDNYIRLHPDALTTVVDEASSLAFVVSLLNSYGVLEGMVFNPDEVAVAKQLGEDDLFSTYQGIVTRFLPSLALDLCEQEGDGEGLLAVERLMVSYFLASNLSSQNVKYADFTLFDVVLLMSSSERTRQRYMENAVINPSGTRGGGMFWDKYCEVGLLDNSSNISFPCSDRGQSHQGVSETPARWPRRPPDRERHRWPLCPLLPQPASADVAAHRQDWEGAESGPGQGTSQDNPEGADH